MTSLAGRSFLRKLGVPRVDDGTVDPGEGMSAAVSVHVTFVGCDMDGLPHSSGEPVWISSQDFYLVELDGMLLFFRMSTDG